MVVCGKPRLRCLQSFKSRRATGYIIKHFNIFVAQHRCFVARHICYYYLLTSYLVRTKNTKPSVTSHGIHFVRFVLCDFGLGTFQYGPGNQLINR